MTFHLFLITNVKTAKYFLFVVVNVHGINIKMFLKMAHSIHVAVIRTSISWKAYFCYLKNIK